MNADNTNLSKILTPSHQYIIPLFQRDYVWTKKEWENLWEDIVEIHNASDSNQSHFMGTLVFVGEPAVAGKNAKSQVIDGQQRLVTLTLLLVAVRDAAQVAGMKDLSEKITDTLLIHKYEKFPDRYRVLPRWRDKDQYMSAVESKAVAGDGIAAALDYFTARLKEHKFSSEEGLQSFLHTVQNKLEFVSINLSKQENPLQVFRSLNSTGVDLAESDLIRNFMFMKAGDKDQQHFDTSYWSELEKHFESTEVDDKGKLDGKAFSGFLRDFLMRNGDYVGVHSTFESFESYCGPQDAPQITKVLLDYVELYDTIRGAKRHTEPQLNSALQLLRQVESSTTYPLILNLLERVQQGSMPVNDCALAVRLIASFIVRRYVCNYTSRTYGKWFVAACVAVNENPLEDLRVFLITKGFPEDAEFVEKFVGFNLYKGNYAPPILKQIEQSIPHKERADLSEATVEHIMPQKLTKAWIATVGAQDGETHKRWLHTPGNLTITKYNAEMARKSYVEKKSEYYQKSHYMITKSISALTWGEQQIESRGRMLAEKAKVIWPHPLLS